MRRRVAALALAAALAGAGESAAGMASWEGHLSAGYAKLFVQDAPGGSLSLAAGVDHAVAGPFRAGVDIGYHLLGTRTVVRGSLFANVDYSVFEVLLLAHWRPPSGPIGRVSLGPSLFGARAELSTAGGGLAFSDLAVEETVGGAALDVELVRRSASPVRVGLEVGARVGFVPGDAWTLALARLAVHY